MPELPEVEAVTRKVRRDSVGARIVEAAVLRARITLPDDPRVVEARIAAERIAGAERRGKNILLGLESGLTLHVHLRMTGNLFVIPDWRLHPHRLSAWFRFDDGRALVFEDSRGLGTLRLLDQQARRNMLAGAGLEPLSKAFSPQALSALAAASRQPVKLFLMDQSKIAGLGNIYAAEALFEARIDPRKAACSVSPAKLKSLHGSIVRILKDAVKSACIAYSRPGGFREAEGYSPAVYDREGEPCLRCRRTLIRITQGGRSTYYCPGCQR